MKFENILPINGPSVDEVKKYINKYNNELIVIKCGGSVLLDSNLFNIFIKDIAVLRKIGVIPVIVHGGGPKIKKKLLESNIQSTFIKGLRVTDIKTIKIVENVLIELNKEIVNSLKNESSAATSITTKENNILSVKSAEKELGFVGVPNKIKINILNEIIKSNKIPVIAPIGLDENGQSFNINADTAAGAIAKNLKSRRLLLMTDVEGVLDKNKKLISEINSHTAKKMINDEIITGGMIPKINTCIEAINNEVKGVVIIDGRRQHSILFELLSDKGSGTLIRK